MIDVSKEHMERRLIDPLGSSASGCTSGPDHDPSTYSMDDSDQEDGGISFTTTETKCERLFEQGLKQKLSGEVQSSLSCFLDCLRGMQECQYFSKLPQTLRHLGELYHILGSYDKAVEFAQAEKLFYEAVIVGTGCDSARKDDAAKRVKSKRKPFGKRRSSSRSSGGGSNPAEYGELLIKKADEYEMLARICTKERKFELAVDYSGKAAKLKRSVYGPDHPVTLASLEYFTLVYAEMGRMEYAMAMRQAEGGIDTCESTADSNVTREHCAVNDTEQLANGYNNSTHTIQNNHERRNSCKGQTPNTPGSEVRAHENLREVRAHESLLEAHTKNEQETEAHTIPQQCQHNVVHTHTPKQGNSNYQGHEPDSDRSAMLVQQLTNLQVCQVNNEHSLNANLTNEIRWSKDPDNDCEYTDCVEVGVIKTDSNIEHARFCPLWVLFLGAFLEMTLVAYIVYLR